MQNLKRLTLAIETAIDGGSISILEGQKEIDFWIGENGISKAEDILENISRLFEANEITKENIELIVISGDVGSTTGLKIGMATAKGLARSFPSRLFVASLIDSLIKTVSPDQSSDNSNEFVIVLPVGKNNIFYRYLTGANQTGASAIVKTQEFFENLNFEGIIYAHQKIIETQARIEFAGKKFVSLGQNMAKVVAV